MPYFLRQRQPAQRQSRPHWPRRMLETVRRPISRVTALLVTFVLSGTLNIATSSRCWTTLFLKLCARIWAMSCFCSSRWASTIYSSLILWTRPLRTILSTQCAKSFVLMFARVCELSRWSALLPPFYVIFARLFPSASLACNCPITPGTSCGCWELSTMRAA